MESANLVDQLRKLCGKARQVSIAKPANMKLVFVCFGNSPDLTRRHHAQPTPKQGDCKACINQWNAGISLEE